LGPFQKGNTILNLKSNVILQVLGLMFFDVLVGGITAGHCIRPIILRQKDEAVFSSMAAKILVLLAALMSLQATLNWKNTCKIENKI
jgi:hypothetical protein